MNKVIKSILILILIVSILSSIFILLGKGNRPYRTDDYDYINPNDIKWAETGGLNNG